MNTRKTAGVKFLAAAIALGVGAAALAQAGMRLMVNDRTASTDVRVIGGRPYVPLSDMAKALHGTLVKKGGGYAITTGDVDTTTPEEGAPKKDADAPGGANQVEGRHGKIGDMLMNGKFRFQVLDINDMSVYEEHFSQSPGTVSPRGAGDKLVVINCMVKNALKARQALGVYGTNTAVTDDAGQSYPPLKYDIRWAAGLSGVSSEEMLPGAGMKFAVAFSVPKDAKLKDLIFCLGDDTKEKGDDVRISLVR